MADSWGQIYPRLSIQDRIALSIAKSRNIILLTGDKALRKAAEEEKVPILKTLGLLDKLYEGNYITTEEYSHCLFKLAENNGKTIRLPDNEIRKRIKNLDKRKNANGQD